MAMITKTPPPSSFLCSDTITHLMLFLDVKSIIKCCSPLSSQFYKCSKSNILWKAIYEQLFMENLFGWRSAMMSSVIDQEEDNDESSESDESDEEGKLKRKKASRVVDKKETKKQKIETPKCEEREDDMYWFNLFRNTLAFPTLDKKFEEIKELSSESIEKIRKIQDKETLYEIIDHLKSQDSDDVPLIDSFQYTYERAPKIEKLKENYLKLALILTVMYNGYQLSYLKDHVVISLKKKEIRTSLFVLFQHSAC